jgi:hypothetical protein
MTETAQRSSMMRLLAKARNFDALLDMVESGNFPETSSTFINNYLPARPKRTSLAYAESVAPSSVPDEYSATTTIDDQKLPVVNLPLFSRGILQDKSDFVVHIWDPTDERLTACLREVKGVVAENLEKNLDDLVTILNKLRDMTSFFLEANDVALPAYMDEVTEFQPLVKQLLTQMVKALMPTSSAIIVPCQRNAVYKLSKVITVVATRGSAENSNAVLKGDSDLARVCDGEHPRYFELKIVGGALYHSDAWKAKDQALGQTVCSSAANKKEKGVAIGALMDLFTVSVIVTVPVEGGTKVVSQMSKRITNARSWVLRVALLLVAPTGSILQLLPPRSDDSIIEVHSEDAVGEDAGVGVGVGGLNLASTGTSDGCGATGSAPNPPASIEGHTEVNADDCNWLAREALRDRHEEKVRLMLEADAMLDGFGFLNKENLNNAGRTATTVPKWWLI